MTSPPITSISPPPAWNSVLSWSKYCPVSEGITLWVTWISPWFCLLNSSIILGKTPRTSFPQEKTSSFPLDWPPPPPQPATPKSAAPASPAPPSLRKSLRLRSTPLRLRCMYPPSPFPCRLGAGPLIMPEERRQVLVAALEQRYFGELRLLVRLPGEPWPEVRRGHPAHREARHVRPRLLRPHLEP